MSLILIVVTFHGFHLSGIFKRRDINCRTQVQLSWKIVLSSIFVRSQLSKCQYNEIPVPVLRNEGFGGFYCSVPPLVRQLRILVKVGWYSRARICSCGSGNTERFRKRAIYDLSCCPVVSVYKSLHPIMLCPWWNLRSAIVFIYLSGSRGDYFICKPINSGRALGLGHRAWRQKRIQARWVRRSTVRNSKQLRSQRIVEIVCDGGWPLASSAGGAATQPQSNLNRRWARRNLNGYLCFARLSPLIAVLKTTTVNPKTTRELRGFNRGFL
jgi:hypothetical protein